MKPQLLVFRSNQSAGGQCLVPLAALILLLSSITAVAQQGPVSPNPPEQLLGQTLTQNPASPMPPSTGAPSGLSILGGLTPSVPTSVSAQPSLTTLNFDSDHVIQLLMANKFRQNTFQNGSELAPGLMLGSPWQQRIGDLELLGVCIDGTVDPRNGPVFEVTLRNNSQETLERVTVSAVAVLGQIHGQSPTSVLSIGQIRATETISIRIQLPASSMVMGPVGSTVQPFETLVVAVDSFDELIENNELNNVSILRRGDIPMIPAAVVAPTVSVVNPNLAVPSQPSSGPAIAAPEAAKPTSPLDAIDPDKLGEEVPATN